MTQKAPKVTIIIPHYNQKDCLQRLLPSLDNQTYKDFEVIIIDDCTPDEETVTFIKGFIKDRPHMHLVQNPQNLRFVKTCNKGIKLAKGKYVCLLNSDTDVRSNFVEKNVTIMDSDATIAGLSCAVVDQHGKNWFCGGKYRKGHPLNLTDDFETIRSVDFIAGTAAFYRTEVFDTIGLFDERYIMYHEDVEFGLRIKARTGYRLCMFPDKLVTHYLVPSISKPELFYYANRNAILLSRRYAPGNLPGLVAKMLLYDLNVRLAYGIGALLAFRRSSSSHWFRVALSGLKGTLHGLCLRRDASP